MAYQILRSLEPPGVDPFVHWFLLATGAVILFIGGPEATQAQLYEEALRAVEPDWPAPTTQ